MDSNQTSQSIEEMRAELARIEQDCRDYPTIDEDEAEDYPKMMAKFGGYANFDRYCRERTARRRQLVRAIQAPNG